MTCSLSFTKFATSSTFQRTDSFQAFNGWANQDSQQQIPDGLVRGFQFTLQKGALTPRCPILSTLRLCGPQRPEFLSQENWGSWVLKLPSLVTPALKPNYIPHIYQAWVFIGEYPEKNIKSRLLHFFLGLDGLSPGLSEIVLKCNPEELLRYV